MRNRALLVGVPVLAMAVLFPLLLIAIIAGFGATSPAQACDHGPAAEQVGSTTLTAEQTLVATQAVAAVRAFPATRTKPHAAVIVLATGYQESRLRNLDYGDRDSLGFLQQRPSQGWGTPAQVRDVARATTTFLQHLVQIPGWETMAVTDAAATVQRPADSLRGAYEQWVPLATTLTARIWPSTSLATPQTEAHTGAAATISGSTSRTTAQSVQLAHANLYAGRPPRQFSADLARVVAGRPDFVTLNETYRRTPAELTPPGYAMWRAEQPFDARETSVLWATDRWQRIDAGTQLMHRHPGKWGTRYVNWVTLQSITTRQRVSVISGHASPGGPGRTGLLREFITNLNTLINRLNAAAPVLVGADLNTHYPHSAFLARWLADSGSATTFDTLGQPVGGWATGIHGGTIDYILTAGATATAHVTSDLPNSDHRLLTATVALSNSGASGAGQQGACSGIGGQSVPENCTANGGTAEAGLTPDALRVMRCALTVFGPHAVGGVGERPNVSDHTTGRAVDIMIDGFDAPAGNSHGWEIARWAQANAVQLGVTYVIFDAKIWSLSRSSAGWRPYSHPTGASSPTLDHRDHVHISVEGAAGTSSRQPISLQAAASHSHP